MARKTVSENAVYRRNHNRLRQRVGEIAEPFGTWSDCITRAIYGLVRDQFGCRIAAIPEANIEAVNEFVAELGRLISSIRGICASIADERKCERDQAERRSIIMEMVMRDFRPRGAPELRLVPNCGSQLIARESSPPMGPSAG